MYPSRSSLMVASFSVRPRVTSVSSRANSCSDGTSWASGLPSFEGWLREPLGELGDVSITSGSGREAERKKKKEREKEKEKEKEKDKKNTHVGKIRTDKKKKKKEKNRRSHSSHKRCLID